VVSLRDSRSQNTRLGPLVGPVARSGLWLADLLDRPVDLDSVQGPGGGSDPHALGSLGDRGELLGSVEGVAVGFGVPDIDDLPPAAWLRSGKVGDEAVGVGPSSDALPMARMSPS
jgi:hypothetical protein